MRKTRLPALALALALFTVPAPAADLPVQQATAWPEATVEEFQGCSFACATSWKLRVSSSLPGEGGSRYDASRLEDGSERTCWASRGKGEWMEWTFTGKGPDWSAPLRGFRLYNGYGKSPDLWKRNSRVRSLLLQVNGTPRAHLRLLDRPGVQSVTFPDVVIHSRYRWIRGSFLAMAGPRASPGSGPG